MNAADFKKLPILGILRGIELSSVEPLVEAICSNGLETIEITMNTCGAPELIKKAVSAAKGRLSIGAGTVLNIKDLKEALSAGASFIVSPVLIGDVMKYCLKNKIPVFPGALTPSEIYEAWVSGATMVKVFPAECFGPEYFKEIKGPLNDIELIACAGVTPENMLEYISCGATAVTFGASVFRKDWLKNKEFELIGNLISKYVQNFKKWKINHD